MHLPGGHHLAYCTNIHPGQTWEETFDSLQRYTLEVRRRVCPRQPYAIGLRLGHQTSIELSQPEVLAAFQRWLDDNDCYIFTINGFPYGRFHGVRVKERVYAPDWTTDERVDYTNRLFDLLVELVPRGIEGSISTVPCSFKEFITTSEQVTQMRANIWRTVEHIARLSERSGKPLHLGLEPEPLCYLETSAETVDFFESLRAERPGDARLDHHLGVNYDACHLAVEYESPEDAVGRFTKHHIKISKIHLSSALRVHPSPGVCQALRAFADDVYFHQVIARLPDGTLRRHKDLDLALADFGRQPAARAEVEPQEWRIHFHIPIHSQPTPLFDTTADHVTSLMDLLKSNPSLCSHFEMETYTWAVLPPELRGRSVVDQLVAEYEWCLARLAERDLA